MLYHDTHGDIHAMGALEAHNILSDYCCTGHPDEGTTDATFGNPIDKVEGALEVARKALTWFYRECNGGIRPQ